MSHTFLCFPAAEHHCILSTVIFHLLEGPLPSSRDHLSNDRLCRITGKVSELCCVVYDIYAHWYADTYYQLLKFTVGLGLGLVFGWPFVKRFALCYQTVVLSVLSVTFLHCGQTVGRIKMKLGMQVGLGPGHIVLDGDPAPSPKRNGAPSPIFGSCLLWPND